MFGQLIKGLIGKRGQLKLWPIALQTLTVVN